MNNRDFTNIKEGDEVVVNTGINTRRVFSVQRITPTQVLVDDGYAYWKKNGRRVGSSNSYYRSSISLADEETKAAIELTFRRERLRFHNIQPNHYGAGE